MQMQMQTPWQLVGAIYFKYESHVFPLQRSSIYIVVFQPPNQCI